MTTTNAFGEPWKDNITRFDTDSRCIGIDNRCSTCISHCIDDFTGPLNDVNRLIKGFGGEYVWNVKMGTIVWKWCDDEGKVHKFTIPRSYYVSDGKVGLLSPQHWARTRADYRTRGSSETTTGDSCLLFWEENNQKYQHAVPLGKQDNVATFDLAPGYANFDVFCQEAKIDYAETINEPICHKATTVSDDEDDDMVDQDVQQSPKRSIWSRISQLPIRTRRSKGKSGEEDKIAAPTQANFTLNGPQTKEDGPTPVTTEEDDDKPTRSHSAELL